MEGQSCAYTRVLYPGTFDPPTLGHISLIDRAKRTFGKVVVAVAGSPSKYPVLNLAKRVSVIKEIYKNDDMIEVISFSGLLVDLAKRLDISVIIRGMRGPSDFEYEYRMATTNAFVNKNLETVFLMARAQYGFISSTLVKQIAKEGGDISKFVPEEVVSAFKEVNGGTD
jgi:pantetheine-phosphate adenylyltransferase